MINSKNCNVCFSIEKILLGILLFPLSSCVGQTDYYLSVEKAKENYLFAQEYGDKADICTSSSIVASEYLDLNDKSNYFKWKDISKKDCNEYKRSLLE